MRLAAFPVDISMLCAQAFSLCPEATPSFLSRHDSPQERFERFMTVYVGCVAGQILW